MSTTPNDPPAFLQEDPSGPYRDNELGGANTEGSLRSAPRLDLRSGPSIARAETDWSKTDLLDPQQPLPDSWLSIPQTALQPDMQHPDLFHNIESNHGSAPADGAPSPRHTPITSPQDHPDPPIVPPQANVRVYPCFLYELAPGTPGTFVHPDVPVPGRLKLVVDGELDHWVSLINMGAGSTLAAQISNKGKGPETDADVMILAAQDNLRATPGLSSTHPFTSAPPPTTRSTVDGWHGGPGFSAQPTHSEFQAPMSGTPASTAAPALPPHPRIDHGPVPTSSNAGRDDSPCTPAATSIRAAPHHHDSPDSLARPPPPISRTANLDPFPTSAPPDAFHVNALINLLSELPPAEPQPAPQTRRARTQPEYPVHGQLSPPGPQEPWPMGEPGDHERMHQVRGHGRS